MPKIAIYITSHGFGHATRAIEVINNLPDLIDIEIITSAPRWLFEHSIQRPFTFHEMLHDCGVIQTDGFQQDAPQTLSRWKDLLSNYQQMAQAEAERLGNNGVDLIFGDISPFASAVGDVMNIPVVITANFSWNWIFAPLLKHDAGFQDVINRIAQYFSKTTMLLRLPLSGDLSIFPDIKDIPLIARCSKKTPQEARSYFGIGEEEKTVLLSFGGMGFDQIDKNILAEKTDYTFLTFNPNLAGPQNVRVLDNKKTYHPDAVQASNIVIAKLGYGVVAECIAHQKPIIYPPRKDFLEHDVFEKELPKFLPIRPIAIDALQNGSMDYIDNMLNAPTPETLQKLHTNGGEIAADYLCDFLR